MFRFCRSSNQVDESSSLRLQRNKDCCWDWTCAVFAVSKRKRNVWNQYSVPDSRHRKNIFTPVRDKGIDRCPLCKRMFFTLSRKAGLFNDFQKKIKYFPKWGDSTFRGRHRLLQAVTRCWFEEEGRARSLHPGRTGRDERVESNPLVV